MSKVTCNKCEIVGYIEYDKGVDDCTDRWIVETDNLEVIWQEAMSCFIYLNFNNNSSCEIGKRVESIQVQRTTPIPNNDLFWIILCGFLLTCACFLV